MSGWWTGGFRADNAVAVAVSLAYSVAKVGHALDGRVGIPGGPTVAAAEIAGAGDVASEQWTLVALGVGAAAIAAWAGVGPLRPVAALIRLLLVAGTALLVLVGAVVITLALFETDHPLRWSQPIAAVLSCVGAGAWVHLVLRLRRARAHRVVKRV